jgi:uncharacterized membrane protein
MGEHRSGFGQVGNYQLKNWVLGSATGIMSLGGLFVAANAGFGVAYYGGLLFFLFAVLFVLFLVKVGYDEGERGTAARDLQNLWLKTTAFFRPTATQVELRQAESGQNSVRSIGLVDLRDALARGLADFKEMPTHILFVIVIYPLVTLIFARMSAEYDVLPLVFPLLAGYTLIGPLVATGMYELSRRRELNLDISRRHVFSVLRSPRILSIGGLGLGLMVVYFAWLWTAWVIYDTIFDGIVPESVVDFVNLILNSPAGFNLIVVGSGVGFVFATVVFTLSVISFPMLLDRDVSIMTAVQTSMSAVLANPVTMAIWGFIVAGVLLLGSLPFFVGLAFALPVLGHATWHLYRKVVVR